MLLSVYAHFVVLGLVISNSTSAHLVWLPRDNWYKRYEIHKDSINFWTSTEILTLKTTISLQHPAYDEVPSNKIWLQKDQQFSRYGRNSHTWSYEPSLWPWTWRQQTNLLARHSGPWWCINIPRLVKESSAVEEILSKWTFTGILNLSCDLDHDHNRAIQSFHKTIHLMMMCHHTKFICKRISHSDNISKSHILIIFFITVTLTLKTANQPFWKSAWLIMMHHHTKFGSKRFCDSESIIWTNIHWHLGTVNQFFCMTLWPMMLHNHTRFGDKMCCGSEDIVWINIH